MFGTRASSLRGRLSVNKPAPPLGIAARNSKVFRSSKDDALRRARRIQVFLAVLGVGAVKLLSSAFLSRPQVTTLFTIWLLGVVFFVVTEANGTLHASQKTENKFWMGMASLLSTILLFLADDSPLKVQTSSRGVLFGFFITSAATYLVHFLHKRSHRQSLEKRASIPKNRSYREAISTLGDEQASLDGVVAEVNDALSRLESALIPGGFRRMFDRNSLLVSERKVIDSFRYATRAQLNYLVLHVNMNVVLYRLKNHSSRKNDSRKSGSEGVGVTSTKSLPIMHSKEMSSPPLQPEDHPFSVAPSDDDLASASMLAAAPSMDEESTEDHEHSRETELSSTRPGSLGSYYDEDSVELFVAKGDLRNALVELLARDRLTDLTTSARASVLDALQVVGMMRNPLTKERAQRWASSIILDTKGDQLSELKTITDAKGSVHSMHKLVYNDITDEAIRASLLSHFQANKRSKLGRKVLSDVDDTLVCSGGRYPAGIDNTYPRHCVYPGAGSFYEALDRGVTASFAPPTMYGSKLEAETDSESEEEWTSVHKVNRTSNLGQMSSSTNKKKRVVVGNLVFLSARPHVYKDMAEKRVYQKFEKLIRARNLHAMPTLLPGDMESGQAYMFRGDFEPMARKKLRNMVEYHSVYPEFSHVFVCDNGQADVRAAELMKERLGASLEAVYVHLVQPIDRTFGFTEGSLEKWNSIGIVFYKTFVGAATDACKRGFIEAASLRRVCLAAVAEFVELSTVQGGRFPGGLVGNEERRLELTTDLVRANEVLHSLTLQEIAPPRSLCMFPVGSTVHTRVFGEGFVRAFRPVDGTYEVALLRGTLIGFFTALDLKTHSWDKGAGGLFPGHHHHHFHQHASIQVGCKVSTPYGEGVVRRYRPSDEIFEVILTKWPALAFLREESVEKPVESSSRIRIWGLGQALIRRTFSSSRGPSPVLKPSNSPVMNTPSLSASNPPLNEVGARVHVHPFGSAVVLAVAREEDSIVKVRFEDMPNAFGFVHLNSLQVERLPKHHSASSTTSTSTTALTPGSSSARSIGGFKTLAPVNVAARAVGAMLFWNDKSSIKTGAEVETPYGNGVVVEPERTADQVVKVRLEWGADAFCHRSQIKKIDEPGRMSRILTLLSRFDSNTSTQFPPPIPPTATTPTRAKTPATPTRVQGVEPPPNPDPVRIEAKE